MHLMHTWGQGSTKKPCVYGVVKGVGRLHKFWGLQAVTDRNRPLDN